MGLNTSKSSWTHTDYSLVLSSKTPFYRNLTSIEGELHLHIRKKLLIEKKLRIDLIGELINNKNIHQIFFTYSFPLVTSHENGIGKVIKKQQISLPFRIPLGKNLPPSCEFKEFSINYHLAIFHDDRLVSKLRKSIILTPPIPHVMIPVPSTVTGSNEVTIICHLEKSVYSGREGSIIPLFISIHNPREKCIYSIMGQLIEMITLNNGRYEHVIWRNLLKDITENTREKQIQTICEVNLTSNLLATYIPNRNGQPDNVPSIGITYEFRFIAQIEGLIAPNLHISVPIGIE